MTTTVPPDCVAFVKVGFKLYACKGEFTVATYTTTTNTPETEVIQICSVLQNTTILSRSREQGVHFVHSVCVSVSVGGK